MNKIKWGIVGPGKIARKFASDFRFSQFGELSAVASTSASRAKKFAKEFDVEKSYRSYHELYTDDNIDIIYIATPNHLHFQNSYDAIKCGKSVLCEKPLTSCYNDTKRLVEYARKSNQYLMEGMWTWFLPAIRKSRQWIEENRIGRIRHIKVDFGFKAPYDPKSRIFAPELGGGSMLDIGIYPIAFAWLMLGKEPQKMNAVIKRASTGVDDDVVSTMIYDDCIVQMGSSFCVDLPNWAYIIGDEGYIAIPYFWRTDRCYLYKKDVLVNEYIDERESFGFNFEIDAVCQDILKGKKESNVFSHDDSLKVSRQIEEVLKF